MSGRTVLGEVTPLSPKQVACLVGDGGKPGPAARWPSYGKENSLPNTQNVSAGKAKASPSAICMGGRSRANVKKDGDDNDCLSVLSAVLSDGESDLSAEDAEEVRLREKAMERLQKFGSQSTARLQLPQPRRAGSSFGSSLGATSGHRNASLSGVRRPSETCKILVVGNPKCGKTSIIRRFVNNKFVSDYTSTIGADYCKKDIVIPGGDCIRMQLWDIAGQERTRTLTRAYFRRARGAVVVCDVSRPGTFDAIGAWKTELDRWCVDIGMDESSGGPKLATFLLANKCDLLEDAQDSLLSGAILEKACQDLGFTGWYMTSAKSGSNIDEAMTDLLVKVMESNGGTASRKGPSADGAFTLEASDGKTRQQGYYSAACCS